MPTLLAGQQWQIALRFTDAVDGTFGEIRPAVRSLRASLGPLDARPTGGSFRLQVGVGASTSANTTAPLPANATAAQVAAALNALPGGGDYAVDFDAGSYLVRRAGGQLVTLTARQNVLRPISGVRVRAYQVDGAWVHEVRLIQAPYAFSDSAAQALPPPPYVQTVVDGYTSPDQTWKIDEVQELIIPAEFRSTYRLTFNYAGGVANTGLPRKTRVLGIEDGPEELQAALNNILKDLAGYDGDVRVSNPTSNVARIVFGGEALSGINVPPLGVEAFPLPGDEGDWTFTLDLNRSEMWVALRGAEAVTVPFEVEADVYIDRNDLSQGWRTIKLWSVPVTVTRPLLYEGLATAQSIDWLRPISPRTYVPFNPDQIITGQQHWVGTIGFGTAQSPAYGTAVSFGTAGGEQIFTIDHDLETEAVHVTVRENEAPGDIVAPKRVRVDGPNSVSVVFGSALSSGEVYGVVITSAGPRSVFLGHTHTTAQVTGLEEIIGGLAERVLALERLLPRSGATEAGISDKPARTLLPAVGEVLPDLSTLDYRLPTVASQIFATPRQSVPASEQLNLIPKPPEGTAAAQQEKEAEEEKAKQKDDPDAMPPNLLLRAVIPGVGSTGKPGRAGGKNEAGEVVPEVPQEPAVPALFPPRRGSRMPVLLQAVQSAAPVNTAVLPVGSALLDGTVYRYTGSEEFFVPGDLGRPTLRLPTQGLFAYKQGQFYRVRSEGGNVYYPVEFERELWRMHLSSQQMPEGATLTIGGELRYRLLGEFFDAALAKQAPLDLAAQYTLYVEALELAEGAALGAVVRTTTLASTRVIVSPVLKSFRWRLAVTRDTAGLASSFTAFSTTTSSSGFAAPFILRMRLGGFDIDDVASEVVRGQVALIMPSTRAEVAL